MTATARRAGKRITARHGAITADLAGMLASQRRFIEEAAHELRTPITIALGHAELLAETLTEQQSRRDVRVIVAELERLRSLSNRLLLIATSQTRDFLRLEPVHLHQLASDVLERWRPTARRLWQLGRLDQAAVLADRERLNLALDALVENAVRHTGDGDEIRISVLHDPRAAGARIVVEDSGEGIVDSDIPYIFDRFRTTGGVHSGSGLGLALVRAVAIGHGGEVEVRSTLGEGSRFDLRLPAARGQASGYATSDQELT